MLFRSAVHDTDITNVVEQLLGRTVGNGKMRGTTLPAMVESGALTDKLARQVIAGVLAGEGDPEQVVASRGLAVVSDDAALGAVIEQAIAAQPAIVAKIRGGKVQAVGALIGVVMRSMGGQADAARVRELLLTRLRQD